MKKKQALPFEGKEDVAIELAAQPVQPASQVELERVGKNLNVAILPPSVRKELDDVGVHLDEKGVIQTGNKWLCVTGEAVVKCVLLISNGMKTPKDAERVAPLLSTLAKSIAVVAGNMSDTVIEKGGQTPVAHKVKAFPAGTSVQSLTQININTPAKPA